MQNVFYQEDASLTIFYLQQRVILASLDQLGYIAQAKSLGKEIDHFHMHNYAQLLLQPLLHVAKSLLDRHNIPLY